MSGVCENWRAGSRVSSHSSGCLLLRDIAQLHSVRVSHLSFFCWGGNFAHKREMYDVHDRISCDVCHRCGAQEALKWRQRRLNGAAGWPTHSRFSNVWEIDCQFLRDEWWSAKSTPTHSKGRNE